MIRFAVVFVVFTLLAGCDDESLKGTLKIAITDAPIDADGVKAANIIITNIEGNQNGNWKGIRNFEQPIGVNLLDFTAGKSTLLIDQFTNPGEFSSIRLSFNVANRNSSLIVSPQSNIVFTDGTTAPLYMREGLPAEVILEKVIGIASRDITDFTLDFDLRKSIRINDNGEYILDPIVRIVNTRNSGNIELSIQNATIPSRVNVYAYTKGSFANTEISETSERVSFFNAITSSSVRKQKVILGFLEQGDYDLVFVRHNESGKAVEILGRKNDVKVSGGEQVPLVVDLEQLSPS